MAPLPIIANVFRCTLNWSAGTQIANNVLHIFSATATETEVGTALDDQVTAAMLETISSSASAGSVDVTKLDGASPTVNVPLTNWDGGGGAEYIPIAPVVVSLTTPVRGKSYRGRIFLPFTAENKQNDGQVSVVDFAVLNAAWDQFLADLVTNAPACALVVASYLHSTFQAVETTVVRPTTKQMRRRQLRVV